MGDSLPNTTTDCQRHGRVPIIFENTTNRWQFQVEDDMMAYGMTHQRNTQFLTEKMPPVGSMETRSSPVAMGFSRQKLAGTSQKPINIGQQVHELDPIGAIMHANSKNKDPERPPTYLRTTRLARRIKTSALNDGLLPMLDSDISPSYEYISGNERKLLPSAGDLISRIDSYRSEPFPPARRPVLPGVPVTVRRAQFHHLNVPSGFSNSAERLLVDMPSPSLAHFSVAKDQDPNCRRKKPSQEEIWGFPKRFNIVSEMIKLPILALHLAKQMRIQELIALYSISKDFHNIVNDRFTSVVMAQALARAPESARIFPFRCYRKLCTPDPGIRQHPIAARAAAGELRTVPSFRWLQMVCFREMVCHQILVILAEDGIPLPFQCIRAMKKIWLLMDIPDNSRRIGLVQNPAIFSDSDIFFAIMFFLKLDMRFTDPIKGTGKGCLRAMILVQPSLSYLWRALRRTVLTSRMECVRMYIRWKYQPTPEERGKTLFGIPPTEIGMLQYEGWGQSRSHIPLQRPDELLLMESVRRNLKLHEKYQDMFLWGYVDPQTLENVEPRVLEMRLDRLDGLEDWLVPKEDRGKNLPPKKISTQVIQKKDPALGE